MAIRGLCIVSIVITSIQQKVKCYGIIFYWKRFIHN